MCIIVAKPAGVELPTWNILETCFKQNPDGAGFMYNHDGVVHIEKGFMSFSEFKKAFRVAKRGFDFKESAVVFHFRIKTHGEVSKECCHPFACSTDLERLRKTKINVRYGVAHNGVIAGRDTNAKKSDTMDYIMTIVSPLFKLADDPMHDKYVSGIIKDTLGYSRLAIMDGNGEILRFGDWYEDEGVYYSNMTYKPRPAVTYKPSTAITAPATRYASYPYYGYGTQTKAYPKFKSCAKCRWFYACKVDGADCLTESDAYYMSQAIESSEKGEMNGAYTYKYDYTSDWDA